MDFYKPINEPSFSLFLFFWDVVVMVFEKYINLLQHALQLQFSSKE